MKKIYILTLAIVSTVSTIFLFQSDEKLVSETERQAYEKFINEHPYNNGPRLTKAELKKIPKKDRPDLAAQQNFLMTLDPSQGKPTPEQLFPVYEMTKQMQNNLVAALPGAASYPWVERGPSNVGGRTRAIMFDPNDGTNKKVWAGGVTGGLWYNNDITSGAGSWTNVGDMWDNIAVTAIAYDPNNTQIFYVGTGESYTAASRGAGIWKTTDGGTTWNRLNASASYYYVNDLVVRDEAGTSVLYVGVASTYYEGQWFGTSGMYRSTNGGTSFSEVMPNASSSNHEPSSIEIAADNRIWVGTKDNAYGVGGGRIYYSDNGTTWNLAYDNSGAGRVELATAPSNANYVYAIIEDNTVVDEIVYTSNKGTSWSNRTEPNDADTGIPATDFSRNQGYYDLSIAVDPNNEQALYVGGIDLFKSTNGGASWTQVSHWYGGFGYPEVHADQHNVTYRPGSSTDILFGNDGGIYYTANGTSSAPTFVNKNSGYNVTQFYACAIHPTAGTDFFLAGAQDNGSQKFTNAGVNNTIEVTGGDGAFCFIDQTNPNYQITSYVYNSFYRSANQGVSFSSIMSDQSTGSFINPADYDDNLDILYSGRTTSTLNRISGITGSLSNASINVALGSMASHIRVSPYTTSSTTLFVGTQAGRLFKVTNADGTPSSTEITGGSFPSGNISCVEIGADENELLVTFSNYGVINVFYTNNGGSSWSIKDGNLPNMPVRWALFNPNNRSEVILATEVGVWGTDDILAGNPSWSASNSGLANVRVDMLQIRDSDDEVIAATHGRGLFSSNGFSGSVTPPPTGATVCDTIITTFPYNESFETDLGAWSQNLIDSIDWTLHTATTTSGSTGPSSAQNGLNYVYTEASTPNFPSKVAILDGPCFDLQSCGNATIDFYYHMYGAAMGTLNLERENGPNNWVSIWSMSGDQGDTWHQASVNLGAYVGDTLKLRFNGETGTNYLSDMAIDNITVDCLPPDYCTPTPTNGTGDGDFIDAVVLGNINNTATGGTSGASYNDYTHMEAFLLAGSNYDLAITGGTYQPDVYAAWIDFNRDGDFEDADEKLGEFVTSSLNETQNINFTVPATVQLGVSTRMRVRCLWNNAAPGLDPCTDGAYGETEDYTVSFGEAPVADFQANFTTIGVNQPINFTDLSTNNPTQWDWIFTGATSTTSTAQNPQAVEYANPGCYEVELTASNGFGSDAETKTCYINVVSYCIPNPNPGTADGDFINGVALETINNQNTGANPGPNYTDYTSQFSANIGLSASYTVNVTSGDWQQDYYAVWIDYNQDGDFADADEKLGEFQTAATNETQAINFTVPATATLGTTRMRVRCLYQGPNLDPCADGQYGETEDYTVNITAVACPTITVGTSSTDVTCAANNGTATATPTGGSAPYTYNWSNGSSNNTISGLSVGSYDVTATDANGCTGITSVSVSQGAAPSITTSFSTSAETCAGNDASATASASGGTAPYTYTWSTGNSGATLNNVTAGTYTITSTDVNGCTGTESVTISQALSFTLTASATDESCSGNDGTATVTVSGGTAPITYTWSTGETTASIVGLTAGNYTVTVTDNSNCTGTETVTVGANAGLNITLTATNENCGNADGEISSTLTGTAPYAFVWSNGATTANITNVSANTYTLTVTDANGCTAIESATVSSTSSPTVVINSNAASCGNNGTATASANGGTAPYNYLWENGETTASISGLSSGFYDLTVTDANGCTATGTGIITSSGGVNVTVTGSDPSCANNDGTANVVANGGDGNFTYAWSNGSSTTSISNLSNGTYTVTVTDGAGCYQTGNVVLIAPTPPGIILSTSNASCANNDGSVTSVVTGGTTPYSYVWSNGSTDQDLIGLSSGNYVLSVTDAQFCTMSASASVGVNGTPPTVNFATTNESCAGNDGSASVFASGGNSPYSYNWSSGGSAAIENNLIAGVYTVTVTDNTSCSSIASTTVEFSGATIVINATSADANCGANDGSASVFVSGGTSPYSYNWNNGNTTSINTNLAAGSYTLTITDSNNCTETTSVIIGNAGAPSVSLSSVDESCFGSADGIAFSTVSGGATPYSFTWNDANNQTSATASGLIAGTYTLSVSDASNCVTIETVMISGSSEIIVGLTSTQSTCGNTDGSVSSIVSGGNSPYTYAWNNGSNTSSLSNVAAGGYTLTVTDANGCSSTSTAGVNDSGAGTLAIATSDVDCFDGNNGTATSTISGGSAPFNYNWSNNATTDNISGLSAGNYILTITDNAGCVIVESANVSEPNELIATEIVTNVTTDCDGILEITVSGGTTPYTYAWSNNATSNLETGLCDGIYEVTVTDAYGCTDDVIAQILGKNAVDELNSQLNIDVYPTPNKGEFTIQLDAVSIKDVNLKINSFTGQLVFEQQIDKIVGTNKINVDISQFAQGVYFLSTKHNKQVYVHKIVVN